MRQRYHIIFKPSVSGRFVGWVEEVPGTITHAGSLEECRHRLREALLLMLEIHRDEARIALDDSCILEALEIDVFDIRPSNSQA